MVTSNPLTLLIDPLGSVPLAFVNLVASEKPTSYLPVGSGRPWLSVPSNRIVTSRLVVEGRFNLDRTSWIGRERCLVAEMGRDKVTGRPRRCGPGSPRRGPGR